MPFQKQIEKCLAKGQIDDAFKILDFHVSRQHPDRAQLQTKMQVDSIWILIQDMQFDRAKDFICQNHFDIREILKAFESYLSNIHSLNGTSVREEIKPIEQYIHIYLNNQSMSQSQSNTLQEKLAQQAKQFLLGILEFYQGVLDAQKKNNSFVEFKSLKYTFPQIYAKDLLPVIEFILIKLYCDFSQIEKLKNILLRPIKPTIIMEVERELQKLSVHYQDHVLPRFYEGCENYSQSFKKYKALFDASTDKADLLREMIRVLGKSRDSALISENLEFILSYDIEIGQELFHLIPLSVMFPDQMLQKIQNFADETLKKQAQQRYLEVIIHKYHDIEERFFSILCIQYIEHIFSLKAKHSAEPLKKNHIHYEEIALYRQKLESFLREHKKYNSEKILTIIKGSWLVEIEIFLYEQEKRHNEAIQIYFKQKQFDQAEAYCANQQENLLTEMFKLYVNKYKELLEQEAGEEWLGKKTNLEARIKHFLEKYAVHPQLDVIKVIEIIPDDWTVFENEDKLGIHGFLKNSISQVLNQKRVMSCSRNLAELDLLNTEYDFVQAKRANIRITKEKRCVVCDNRIGDKLFVVYPNGVTAHHNCINHKSLSECPITKQNFEKTYKD